MSKKRPNKQGKDCLVTDRNKVWRDFGVRILIAIFLSNRSQASSSNTLDEYSTTCAQLMGHFWGITLTGLGQ